MWVKRLTTVLQNNYKMRYCAYSCSTGRRLHSRRSTAAPLRATCAPLRTCPHQHFSRALCLSCARPSDSSRPHPGSLSQARQTPNSANTVGGAPALVAGVGTMHCARSAHTQHTRAPSLQLLFWVDFFFFFFFNTTGRIGLNESG